MSALSLFAMKIRCATASGGNDRTRILSNAANVPNHGNLAVRCGPHAPEATVLAKYSSHRSECVRWRSNRGRIPACRTSFLPANFSGQG
jgi:hypothetical protein